MVGYPPELGLCITDLLAIPATVSHRIDHPLSRQSVADDPHWSCGAKPTCHAATLPQMRIRPTLASLPSEERHPTPGATLRMVASHGGRRAHRRR